MKITDDDFTLFGLPPRFGLDRAALDARWKALQSEVHPDRFTAEGAAAQRVAMQWAVRVNEAYRRLKDPVARASLLCEMHGSPVDAERNTAMPADFLMQQMQWREALDEVTSTEAAEALAEGVAARRKAALADLGETLDARQDWPAAAAQVRALMFIERFSEDVAARLEALEQ
jgi:molecular chaperone HscB